MAKPGGNQKPRGKVGGPRPGSGRKPKLTTVLKRMALKEANGEAEKSLAFCVEMRDDVTAPKGLRLAAASEVMDRVWGKAVQAIRPVNAAGEDAPLGIVYEPVAASPSGKGDAGL